MIPFLIGAWAFLISGLYYENLIPCTLFINLRASSWAPKKLELAWTTSFVVGCDIEKKLWVPTMPPPLLLGSSLGQ
jgi:hypothetical protein